MKPEDWEVLTDYIRARADDLALRDWTFVVRHDPPTEQAALAETTPIEGRRHAALRFCVEFRELTDDEQRHVVVHELLHCHLGQLQHLVDSSSQLRRTLGEHGAGILGPIALAIEYAVDGISDGIAGHYPHIAWTSDEPTREESANAPYEGPIDQAAAS